MANVQDEPRPWLARAVLLGARIVTAMVVGSGALLGIFRLSLVGPPPKEKESGACDESEDRKRPYCSEAVEVCDHRLLGIEHDLHFLIRAILCERCSAEWR